MPNVSEAEREKILDALAEIRDSVDSLIRSLDDSKSKSAKALVKRPTSTISSGILDFSMPLRAFVKKHSNGMSGGEKFVLLLAYLARGDLSKEVQLSELESHWNRITAKGLMEMKFNRVFSVRARENDWVEAVKSGAYRLRPNWKSVLK